MRAQLSSIRADGSRLPIHPLEVKGRWVTRRRLTFALLIAIYVAAPLVKIGGHPAVHLDVAARRFYLLGGTFNAQDFWMVLLLATGFLFSVLFVTAWRGRLWCGWGCPQTVFLEAVYRPIERLFDGPASRRLKQHETPWALGRVARTAGKFATYAVVSAGLAHVATSLFVSAHELRGMISDGPHAHPEAFAWTTAFTALLFFNFGWFREQFCVVLCPYGRLQSVLHDRRSITVAYDAARGEPRGKVAKGNGDCVDCKKCVQACPTAIDIRDGLQMECLACAQCIDACDDVMAKVGRQKGLIRYTSQAELAGQPRRVFRPRLLLYAALATAAATTLTVSLVGRTPFEANVLRLRGVPFVIDGDRVRNQLEVHLVNKRSDAAELKLSVRGPDGLEVQLARDAVALGSLEDARVPLVVSLPKGQVHGKLLLELVVTDTGSGLERRAPIPFIAP
ncbi:MAG: cytochrome c oxidase accessory protein CcoG [Myxococcaceae bacterium]|nr:cytochrome c oxidase accessory protein CcoG [Myxococcaceae bacterium]